MKFIRVIIGVILAICLVLATIDVRDTFQERSLQTNIHKVHLGMSETEVKELLGEPTSRVMSDIPGEYWCYGSSTWQRWEDGEIYCGNILLEMSSIHDGRVESINVGGEHLQ